MDPQSDDRVARVEAGWRRRVGLIGLVGVGLVLLVLASAPSCTKYVFESDNDGWYAGESGTGAGPVICTGCTITVFSRTMGEEVCIPDFGGAQTDWNYFWDDEEDTFGSIPLIHVYGEGGYNDNWWDCIIAQGIFWTAYHEWENDWEDGTGNKTDSDCRELLGDIPGC